MSNVCSWISLHWDTITLQKVGFDITDVICILDELFYYDNIFIYEHWPDLKSKMMNYVIDYGSHFKVMDVIFSLKQPLINEFQYQMKG